MTKQAIGIDLGTTYSCVGVYKNGNVEIIANDQGNRTTPSYVSFNNTERLIGDAAKSQVNTNPNNTVFDAKRLIGRRFDDKTVQEDMKHYPYKIIKRSEKPVIEVEYNASKDGNLIPRVIFEPVKIGGVTINKATAHNAKFIKLYELFSGLIFKY